MFANARRCLLGVTLLVVLPGIARAQDFILPYVKTPETAREFWAAIKYEVELGNYRRGGERLKEFWDRVSALPEKDQNDLLMSIHDTDGMSWFLRLGNIPETKAVMGKDPASDKEKPVAELLIAKVGGLVNQRLGDAERIKFFVNNLAKSPEERNYAILQLRQSGPRAMPFLMDVLKDESKGAANHQRVLSALTRMNADVVPPLLACLDVKDPVLRTKLVRLLVERGDNRAIPHLWFLSEMKDQPEAARKEARDALLKFLNGNVRDFAEAKAKCVKESEKYYNHQVTLPANEKPTIWKWTNEEGLKGVAADKSQWEEYQGVYWAKKALDLDPAYRPAQIALLSVAMEKALERGGLEQPLSKTAPAVQHLLPAASRSLLENTLDKALTEGRTAVALAACRALAAHGDAKLVGGMPPLVRALSYPDRRVQLAAADAILHVPSNEAFTGASRVVEVLGRALDVAETRKVVIGDPNGERAQELAAAFRGLGFEPVPASTGKQLMKLAGADGNVELVVVSAQLMEPPLPTLLGQLRGGIDTASLPVLILSAPADEKVARAAAEAYPRVTVASPIPASAEMLKHVVTTAFNDPFRPALSDTEKKSQAALALDWLTRLAENHKTGYDVGMAQAYVIKALQNDDLLPGAVKVLAHQPNRAAQAALVEVVLNATRTPAARAEAARQLRTHFLRFGTLVKPDQVAALAKLPAAAEDGAFKEEAQRLATSLINNVAAEGDQLKKFDPTTVAKPEEEKK